MGAMCFRHQQDGPDSSNSSGSELDLRDNLSGPDDGNDSALTNMHLLRPGRLERRRLSFCIAKTKSRAVPQKLPKKPADAVPPDLMDSLKTKTLRIFAEMSAKARRPPVADGDASHRHVQNAIINSPTVRHRREKRVPEPKDSECKAPPLERSKSLTKRKGLRGRQIPKLKYVKKAVSAQAQPIDFFGELDAEVEQDLKRSEEFVKWMAPMCEAIRAQIQSLARATFAGM